MPADQTHAEIVAALTARWPEHRVAPSLGRIRALTELLGDPQHCYPVIHLTGTNGKGSTAAMIDSLLRADGLRTGRFTSPHVMGVTERITVNGEPISDERFDEVWREIEPYAAIVDDHIMAGQPLEAAQVLLERCAEVGALIQREGIEFGVIDRQLAVGGQLLRVNASEGPVDEIFLPLHGAHQAANAAQALAAVEAFLGMKALNPDVAREGFAAVRSPGRLELVRRSPAIVLDAAHNPHGARAAAAGITEAFAFAPLVGVVAVMGDKDARGLLQVFEEIMNAVVVTQVASTSRGMPAEELAELAAEIFGAERVRVAPRLDDAIDAAVSLAEESGVGLPGVLITGSVVAVGEARTLLGRKDKATPGADGDPDDDWDPDAADAGADESIDGREWP